MPKSRMMVLKRNYWSWILKNENAAVLITGDYQGTQYLIDVTPANHLFSWTSARLKSFGSNFCFLTGKVRQKECFSTSESWLKVVSRRGGDEVSFPIGPFRKLLMESNHRGALSQGPWSSIITKQQIHCEHHNLTTSRNTNEAWGESTSVTAKGFQPLLFKQGCGRFSALQNRMVFTIFLGRSHD